MTAIRVDPQRGKKRGKNRISRIAGKFGPGLVTGASDDDPSGIGTYSQAGAQFGFALAWTMLLAFPLMAAIQEISARIGRTSGHGIAGNLRHHYPNWLLQSIVALLLAANTINIGADLSAMGDAMSLLTGGPGILFVVIFAAASVGAIVWLKYETYARVLKWLTLSLLAYVAVALSAQVPWSEALAGLLIPRLELSKDYLTTLVAILGTTISPYLFFWQSAQEVENLKTRRGRQPLLRAPRQALSAFSRIRADTLVGMGFSNLIAVAIIFATAATLHKNGITQIESSAQAAEALRPAAGEFAFALFALGLVGTGLLAVPVLAGSAAYALGEARHWNIGLSRRPKEAVAFYATIALATLVGIAITLGPIDPLQALFWSAVINGVIAVPLMVVLMLMAADRKIMGKFVVGGALRWLGWAATLVMILCGGAMILSWAL